MDEFAQRLAAPTPTPGGGAAAARVGVYACSLLQMVTGITLARAQGGAASGALDDAARVAISGAQAEAQGLAERFETLQDEDMAAFQSYLDALRLPRGTESEKAARLEARRQAAWRATRAPLATMDAARGVLALAARLLDLSQTTPLKAESDLGAGIELALAAYRVAELNVKVNLPELAEGTRELAQSQWRSLADEVKSLEARLRDTTAA